MQDENWFSKGYGKKPRKKITWSSKLGVGHGASNLTLEWCAIIDQIPEKHPAQNLKMNSRTDLRKRQLLTKRKHEMWIGTWNVRTLNYPGALQNLKNQMTNLEDGERRLRIDRNGTASLERLRS